MYKKIWKILPITHAKYASRSFKQATFQKLRDKRHADLVNTVIENSRINTLSDWKYVRHKILDHEFNRGQYTQNNIDAIILGYCATIKNCDLGTSYLNFLSKENIKPNLATLGKYLKLLYAINENTRFVQGKMIPKIEEELILRCYDDLRRKYPVLDSISLQYCILALSVTSEWRKCIELIQEMKLTANPNQATYSAIVAASFVNGDEDLAWQYLDEICSLEQYPHSIGYLAYISVLRMLPRMEVKKKLDRLFLFFQSYDIKCQYSVTKGLTDLAERCHFQSNHATVSYKGECSHCNNQLDKFNLTDNEFQEVKSDMLENVIVGRDVFTRSDPGELEKFKLFVQEMGTYDVVLDGLNIAYSAGKQTPFIGSSLVAATVASFVERHKRVLVLGRVHMTKWPKENWTYITRNSSVFLTKNMSQDDPYLLYCALHSGKNTIVVSRDLMRSHKFRLKLPKHKMLFNRWLTQQQYQLIRVDNVRGPIFRIPPKFTITAQKNNNTWHVPHFDKLYNEEPGSTSSNRDKEFHKTWFCLTC